MLRGRNALGVAARALSLPLVRRAEMLAEIMRLRGFWSEAVEEAQRACERFVQADVENALFFIPSAREGHAMFEDMMRGVVSLATALALPLVIADGSRRIEALRNVSLIYDVPLFGRVSPHTGEAIGL